MHQSSAPEFIQFDRLIDKGHHPSYVPFLSPKPQLLLLIYNELYQTFGFASNVLPILPHTTYKQDWCSFGLNQRSSDLSNVVFKNVRTNNATGPKSPSNSNFLWMHCDLMSLDNFVCLQSDSSKNALRCQR